MRFRPDGGLRITIPRGGSKAEALRFVERHLTWAVKERARRRTRPTAAPWGAGTRILLDGQSVPLTIEEHAGSITLAVGPIRTSVASQMPDYRVPVQRALRAAAAGNLPARLLELATRHGLTVARVIVRDQRSRWGSCSASGVIALNYRLIQMPADVREYVMIHELAHLVHANHSRRFWRTVERMCPAFRSAERWLKSAGQSLF
jgi:predicted metal-dependent hydrolase